MSYITSYLILYQHTYTLILFTPSSDKTVEKPDSKKVKKANSSPSLSSSPGNQSSLPQPQYEGLWSHDLPMITGLIREITWPYDVEINTGCGCQVDNNQPETGSRSALQMESDIYYCRLFVFFYMKTFIEQGWNNFYWLF